jgi:hypothetical protein
MRATTRQSPHQEGVDRPKQDLAPGRARTQAVVRIQQVLDLRPRKIGIDHEPGLLSKGWLVTSGFQSIADGRCHATLPHNRVRDRPT